MCIGIMSIWHLQERFGITFIRMYFNVNHSRSFKCVRIFSNYCVVVVYL